MKYNVVHVCEGDRYRLYEQPSFRRYPPRFAPEQAAFGGDPDNLRSFRVGVSLEALIKAYKP